MNIIVGEDAIVNKSEIVNTDVTVSVGEETHQPMKQRIPDGTWTYVSHNSLCVAKVRE
jgi:hypothetical protein